MRLTGAALKRFAKRSIRQLGIDIRRTGAAGGTPDLADFLAARQVDVVLDVGANRGQFGQWLRDHGYRDAIVSFEPIGSVFSDLNAAAERDGNWQAHRLAIGSAAGRALLNVSRTPSTARSRPIGGGTAVRYGSGGVRQEEVEIARLDDLFAPYRTRTVFPKIDTQGYERPVLEGAREVLSKAVGVQLELPLVNLYECTWSLADALLT